MKRVFSSAVIAGFLMAPSVLSSAASAMTDPGKAVFQVGAPAAA